MCDFCNENFCRSSFSRPFISTVYPVDVSAALDRLIAMANGDSGGSRRCADFLLAWWNGPDMGHFPILHLCNVDHQLAQDMMTCMGFLVQNGVHYAYHWSRRADMEKLIDDWRE
jgi:hypothetical protein